ncbi:hypothetical protein JVT61DRAFT_13604 [Boletus reticuloceps]|uniref:T6SS Phospholipase effector Tle1-like catalytic domain-containing protein n=1 Tax=Boletus reticuloceps TaxID=495285 RepID=A0A8I2YD66_9AGAM|nr:hypothetical protein JVT61DRAFT_13604 [Boletus reticuloceps]
MDGLGKIPNDLRASLWHRLSNEIDTAIGWNFHKVILASYRWLSDNYQDGDQLFLFGFSRGAYQVRVLAGMIAQVGLVLPGNSEQIPFAFDLYSKMDDDDSSRPRRSSIIRTPADERFRKKVQLTELTKTFRKTFCRTSVHVHFVGVWDTVSSVGFGRNMALPYTTPSYICHFRHALALDERRVKFLPDYVCGRESGPRDDARVKEVWFAGSHSDVGGCRRNEKLYSGDIPLLWMRSQAISAGLKMEPADLMWKIGDFDKQNILSFHPKWRLLHLQRFFYNAVGPHSGGFRRILPGQKVHVSALFRHNYRPYARFYDHPEWWPEPMLWNDATSHQRLQNMSGMWEKDILDEGCVQTLLNDLSKGPTNLDAIDRLAFMASFDVCKKAISNYKNAKQVLAIHLRSGDRVVRLSTAVTYCELGWDWPLERTYDELGQQVAEDITEMLRGNGCRRACIYLPSLCKRAELRASLTSEDNLRSLIRLCSNTRFANNQDENFTVAFHSAQALSMLMKLDIKFTKTLIDIDAVTHINHAMRSNCNPALVPLINVMDGLAKHENGRAIMKSGHTVPALLNLVKRFDDLIAPAATRVLCSLLPEDDLRGMMLQLGVLSILLDMLERCSDQTKQVACHALVKFAQYDDIQHVMSRDGYLRKLAIRSQSHVQSKRGGAIIALVALGNARARVTAAVMQAIKAAKTIHILVTRLNQKSTALSAASALADLVKIDDVAVMVADDKCGAQIGIVGMLQRRWFDGLRGEDGLQVMSRLLECERLRLAVLKAGAVGVLCEMIDLGDYERTYAGLHYLRVVARFGVERSTLPTRELLSLTSHVVNALRVPYWRVKRIAMEILSFLSAEEDLRAAMAGGLLSLLGNRHAGVVFAASTLLGSLVMDKSVRDGLLMEEAFWKFSREYYEGLNIDYDEENGPCIGEAYESVGNMIKLILDFENGEVAVRDTVKLNPRGQTGNAGCLNNFGNSLTCMEQQSAEKNRWFAHVPYEPEKNRRGGHWIMWRK